jgi:hypothetical protein
MDDKELMRITMGVPSPWLKKHFYGITEAIRTGLSNSVAEGLNNKVKTVVKRSYGFKTVEYRNTMIYLVTGKLDLCADLPTQC